MAKMKELYQSDFHITLIEDLGMKQIGIRKVRRALFECSNCSKEIELTVGNAKKQFHYCKHCASLMQKQAITIPLDQSKFKMRIIQDLGVTVVEEKSLTAEHYALFECTACRTNFIARSTGKTAQNQTTCHTCTTSPEQYYKHPLYAIWNGIKQRCYSIKRKDYENYGGKGVTMCDEWKNNSTSFIEWCINNGWNENLHVDKDKLSKQLNIFPAIYSPETITFLTPSENNYEKFK
jgi:hypothetical protein